MAYRILVITFFCFYIYHYKSTRTDKRYNERELILLRIVKVTVCPISSVLSLGLASPHENDRAFEGFLCQVSGIFHRNLSNS